MEVARAQLLTRLRRVLPRASWRRLGDLLEAAVEAPDVDAVARQERLALGLVLEGRIQVRLPGGESRSYGPGDIFGAPGRRLDPATDGELVHLSSEPGERARYLRLTDRLLYAFHRVDPAGFPPHLPPTF